MAQRVAVDIGGTFTDLVTADDGKIAVVKASTTPGRFEEGVMHAMDDVGLSDVEFLAHGTTVVINALTERKGVETALFTTCGCRDVLEIQRGNRPDLFNLLYCKPKPFVPRRMRLEIDERLDTNGHVVRPLDETSVRAAIAEARRHGAQAVAICLLHSYANPAHEQRVAEIVREEWPDVSVSCSSDLSMEWREYQRMSTAVLDAYVKPTARRYLSRLATRLEGSGIGGSHRYVMQSNGGLSQFHIAEEQPIHLVESGPVGGIIGAAAIGSLIDVPNIITLDIGGTTAKSSLIEGGAVRITGDYHIERTPETAGYPIRVPVVDIVEIGAGGGSIAWLDEAGGLKVGPHSAAAAPGPAAYGKGGTEPTLTDANLVAGRINPEYFLGGKLSLDVGLAREAIATIAGHLDRSVEETALGIIRLADASMINLLKLVSVRRGRDPREFALMASGGGGPLHACALARELRVSEVIVPPHPGAFSAWGMLMSDIRHDVVQTRVVRLEKTTQESCRSAWDSLRERVAAMFRDEGIEDVRLVRALDMRYVGQDHTVRVELSEEDDNEAIARSFQEGHNRLYGFQLKVAIEIVNFRLTGFGAVRKPDIPLIAASPDPRGARKGTRLVNFDDVGWLDTAVYERSLLGAGASISGPAVVEETASSTIIFPGQSLVIDTYGNLRVTTEV